VHCYHVRILVSHRCTECDSPVQSPAASVVVVTLVVCCGRLYGIITVNLFQRLQGSSRGHVGANIITSVLRELHWMSIGLWLFYAVSTSSLCHLDV